MNPWAWWRRTFFGGLHWFAVNGALLFFTVALATWCAYATMVILAARYLGKPP